MYNWYWSEKVPHKLALIDQDIRNRQYAAGHKLPAQYIQKIRTTDAQSCDKLLHQETQE
jgi:hypothetical protein